MKINKIVSVVTIMISIMIIISNFVLAVDPSSYTGNTENAGTITTMGNKIIGIVQVIGSITAVAILIILGIKYMMGSTEEKAAYKKTLIPYLIGAVLIFAASNLASIIYNWATTNVAVSKAAEVSKK